MGVKSEKGQKSFEGDSRLIVALDTPSLDLVEKLVTELEGLVSYYKIGFELFTAHGWDAVKLVKKTGAQIFLDLKLHDIPSTVAKTAAVICEHGVDMFNVHALGGLEMMQATRKAVNERTEGKKAKPIILAVTLLTSHSEAQLANELGIQKSLKQEVIHLAGLTKKAGLDGVVCSPQEIELIQENYQDSLLIVTPGIRSATSRLDDQKRTFSAFEALSKGAHFIVVGRPITAAEFPAKETLAILKTIKSDIL